MDDDLAAAEQESAALGAPTPTFAAHEPAMLPASSMPAGQEMAGAVVSRTVTSKLHEAVLPAASVAVAFTAVVPTGKTEPGGCRS